ncbi:MAG: hypothetical protein ACYTFI_01415 [Planctomycetota bacterium]|jgi:hypothetical protein
MRCGIKRRASAVGLGSAIVFLASFSFAGEAPARFEVKSFAEVMAPGTLLYVEVPDFARAREAYRRTPRWDLWWRGAGRKLISASIRDSWLDEEAAVMRALVESLKIPAGKLAYAMVPPAGEDMDEPGAVLLAEAGERAVELEGLLVKMADLADAEKRERTIGGVRFTEMEELLLLGRAGGLVIGGVGRPAVEGVLARFDERPWQSLAASQAFKMARERVGRGSDFFCFANFGEFWRFLRMDMADEEVAALTRSGLTQLAAVAQGGRFTPAGVIDSLTFILSGRGRGIWQLLEPQPLTRRTWKDLPDFTSGFVSVKLPLAERAKPFVDFLRSMDPETAADIVDTFAEFRQDTGISFDKDILPLATGEVTVAFLEEPEGGLLPDPEFDSKTPRLMVFAVELADVAKARTLMARIARAEDYAERRRFGDLDGCVVDFGFFDEYYVTGRDGVAYIAFSADPLERLAAHFAKGGARLVDSAEFEQAVAWIPKDTGFVGYSSVRKLLRSTHALLVETLDFEEDAARRLPPAEALMADLTPFTAALRIEKPGFTFDIRSPDGYWAFYLQLAAHLEWRWGEEMGGDGLPVGQYLRRYGAKLAEEGKAEAARGFDHLGMMLAKIKRARDRIAALEAALGKEPFAGHAEFIKAMIARERQNLVRERDRAIRAKFGKLMTTVMQLKTPQERIGVLEAARPAFAGTTFEMEIRRLIDREKRRQAARRGGALAIKGKVLAVRPDVNLVMLSVGSDDLVEKGMTFLIHRGGQPVGRVRVEKTFSDMCSARIVEELRGRRMREGDGARLRSGRPTVPDEADDVF